jgi:cytochrome c-type biogenesis protein CcmE
MHLARKQKLYIVLFILLGSAVTVGLLMVAFEEGLNVFITPTEVAEGKADGVRNVRIGGMVKAGSVKRDGLEGTQIEFVATDFNADVPVSYDGVLPDLFREGQGVVAEGYIDASGVFQARTILAKHDENYMSAEVKNALDAAERKKAESAMEAASNP